MTTEELREHLDYLRGQRFTWVHMLAVAGAAVASCIERNVKTDREIHEVERELREQEDREKFMSALRAEETTRGLR